MAARSPRKIFASPFVVTLAACFTETPPPQQPTPQPSQPQPRPDVVAVENPPRPTPPPTEPTQGGGAPTTYNFDQRWTVHKNDQGTCSAMARVDCPKPKKPGDPVPTCNPPPPMKVECPADWDGKAPLAIVQYANQSHCQVEQPPIKCPPNATCNPPPPRKVACPTYR